MMSFFKYWADDIIAAFLQMPQKKKIVADIFYRLLSLLPSFPISFYSSIFLKKQPSCSHQDALVDAPVAHGLHADPDDTRVGHLPVVDGQPGPRGAAGRARLGTQDQGGGAEVRVGGAARGAGETGRGRGGGGAGGEVHCDVVERAREGLREEGKKERDGGEHMNTVETSGSNVSL